MRRLTSLLLVVVAFAAAWNFYQLEKMRQELREIRAKVHVEKSTAAKDGGAKSDDGLLVVLAQVKKHSKSAKTLIAKGDYKKARQELDTSLRRLERASELSTELAADAESGLGKVWSQVRYKVHKTWKAISEDQGKGS